MCAGAREAAFRATVLGKYDVPYLFCRRCGLLQTQTAHWLAEAYAPGAIADADTGLVARNLASARVMARLLYFLMERRARYLDVAGGFGLLTRLMRDAGFDYYWSDPHCENRFARGFSLAEAPPPFAALSAIEALEHVHDPLGFVREWFERARTRTLVFTTELFEGEPPGREWWYYGFSSGQHVSFYQRRTLSEVARALGVRALSSGRWHLFTDRPVSAPAFRFLVGRLASLLDPYVRWRMPSRTESDSARLLPRGAEGTP